MSLVAAIRRTQIDILSDNELPRDLIVAASIKNALLTEVQIGNYLQPGAKYDHLLGMRIEYAKAAPLNRPQLSIRTDKGDMRIVTVL